MKIKVILFFIFALLNCTADAQVITTVAGTGNAGFSGDNGLATDAELNALAGVSFDYLGNLYIADYYNNRIRKVNTAGIITTIAGISGGPYIVVDGQPATNTPLNRPTDVVVDGNGNIYIADTENDRIRKIDELGFMHTVAGGGTGGDGGLAVNARLSSPTGVAVDNIGNIYIADGLNNRVRKVDSLGIITTIAGNGTGGNGGDDGPATAARLNQPYCVRLDKTGNIYVSVSSKIRKFQLGGNISTVAGTDSFGYNGDNISATTALLGAPEGITIDDSNNLYIAEWYNHRIRKVNNAGTITTIAGNGIGGYNGDGIASTAAELHYPRGVALDVYGNVYIGDALNKRIRSIRCSVGLHPLSNVAYCIGVYPNPNKGHFVANVISAIDEKVKIKITNMAGIVIKEIDSVTNKAAIIEVDAPAGMYLVTATAASGIWNTKILLSK